MNGRMSHVDEQELGGEPGLRHIIEEVGEFVVATGTETDHRSTAARQVGTQSAQYLDAGTRSKERHTLPADRITSNGSVMPRAGKSSSARSATR